MSSILRDKLNYNLLKHIYYQDRVGNKEGFVKIYPNNTDLHENCKWALCRKLKKLGYSIYTECRFSENQGRADIVAIKDGIGHIYEVVVTEKEKSIAEKRDKYPQDFDVIVVDARNFKIEDYII